MVKAKILCLDRHVQQIYFETHTLTIGSNPILPNIRH